MDIYSLEGSAFKLKGKNATTQVDINKVIVDSGEDKKEFSGPGEYESKGVTITGISSRGGVIFVINQDYLNLVYLGSQEETLSEEQMQYIIDPDILFVSAKSHPVVSQLEPKVIVVTNGQEKVEPILKLSINKEKLPEEPMVVVLKHG